MRGVRKERSRAEPDAAAEETSEGGESVRNSRKIDTMHMAYGKSESNQCRDCCNLIGFDYRGHRYYKCKLYGISHSEATDWRLKYSACGAYNIPANKLDVWDTLKRAVRERNPEPPLEGQIRVEEFECRD